MTGGLDVDVDLRDLILRALGTNYKRHSSTGGQDIPTTTSSRYQTIALGDFQTSGVREDRAWLLDSIDFTDKKVLDLGSNLGEVSRAARARGAHLVDGFEADSYFLEIAGLVNAFTGATRVSFHQRDISDPSSYEEHYDIVLALAVFTYIKPCLPEIAETADLLVLETHRLKGNLDITYINPISRHFPHYRFLGQSDWRTLADPREARMVIAFAKEKADLEAVLGADETTGSAGRRNGGPEPRATYIDVARTRLPTHFYSKFRKKRLRAVDELELDREALAHSRDVHAHDYTDWEYWFLYLKGYLDYRRTGNTGPGNVYYDYLVDQRAENPAASRKLHDQRAATEYVARQFQDLDLLRSRRKDPDLPEDVAQVRAVVTGERSSTPIRISEVDKETPHAVRWLDGWHTIVGATVFKVPRLRCELVREAQALRPIRGAVDYLSVEGNRLQIRGWCLDPYGPIDRVEVHVGATAVGTGGMVASPDIRESFRHVTHAARSRFAIDCEHALELDGLTRFDLIPLREGLPVGRMSAHYRPDMFDEREWPPEQLAKRVLGTSDPRKRALMSLNTLHDMLEPVGRYRKLRWFYSVLDWGCGCGLLEMFMQGFLPRAAVTGIDTDEEAIDWCRRSGPPGTYVPVGVRPPTRLQAGTFDLVLANGTLSRLGREGQDAWLAEIRRLLTHGGFAVVTVNGELMRPFLADKEMLGDIEAEGISDRAADGARESSQDTNPSRATYQTRAYSQDQFASGLDVIAYSEGGANSRQDLMVLRKR